MILMGPFQLKIFYDTLKTLQWTDLLIQLLPCMDLFQLVSKRQDLVFNIYYVFQSFSEKKTFDF